MQPALLALLSFASFAFADEPSRAPTPAEEHAAFRLAEAGLSIELVASEPAVQSPVAVAWDERGALYVAEMRDYPDAPSGGVIKRLEDRDGDGVYETVSVFADMLPFPNGVAPHEGGILVTAAPNLWYLKDTDGDGRADERRIVLSGFHEGNQQLRVNSPHWGLDNHLYLANGRSGGKVRGPYEPEGAAVSIDRNDLRVLPGEWKPRPVAGFSQFGLGRDDWGDRFPSWNTVPFRHVVIEADDGVAEVLEPGDSRVFPIAPAPQTFNGESFAFFNASCGTTIFRGDALGEAYRGNAFVCEPLTSLVHMRRLEPKGPTFVARRAEPSVEFLASSHPWFKPVNLATGPDGALYVVDFCRALVEHPAFVRDGKGAGIDFRLGHEMGRIWRVRPQGPRAPAGAYPTNLAASSAEALVSLLEHQNAWQRDTAQRLLVERGAREAAAALAALVKSASSPAARAQAAWTLAGIGMHNHEQMIEKELVETLLHDPDARLREQGLRLIQEPALGLRAETFEVEVLALVNDRAPRVRLRALSLCGPLGAPARIPAIAATVLDHEPDSWERRAIASAVGGDVSQLLELVKSERPDWLRRPTKPTMELLHQLAAACARAELPPESRQEFLIRLGTPNAFAPNDLQARLVLLAGWTEAEARLRPEAGARGDVPPAVETVLREAAGVVVDERAAAELRALALSLLVGYRSPRAYELVVQTVKNDRPDALQRAAARGIVALADQGTVKRVLADRLATQAPVRRALIADLTGTGALAGVLLGAIEEGLVDPTEVEPAARAALRQSPTAAVREQAARVLPSTQETSREEIMRRYEAALSLKGDVARGERLFAENCTKCHQWRGEGHQVGPDLASVAGRPKEFILRSVLDPNREVAPDQTSYVAELRDGRIVDGLLAGETAGTIRLRRAEGVEESLPRDQVEAFRATGRSLMPEGFEETLGVQDVADLIACLRRPAAAARPR